MFVPFPNGGGVVTSSSSSCRSSTMRPERAGVRVSSCGFLTSTSSFLVVSPLIVSSSAPLSCSSEDELIETQSWWLLSNRPRCDDSPTSRIQNPKTHAQSSSATPKRSSDLPTALDGVRRVLSCLVVVTWWTSLYLAGTVCYEIGKTFLKSSYSYFVLSKHLPQIVDSNTLTQYKKDFAVSTKAQRRKPTRTLILVSDASSICRCIRISWNFLPTQLTTLVYIQPHTVFQHL